MMWAFLYAFAILFCEVFNLCYYFAVGGSGFIVGMWWCIVGVCSLVSFISLPREGLDTFPSVSCLKFV